MLEFSKRTKVVGELRVFFVPFYMILLLHPVDVDNLEPLVVQVGPSDEIIVMGHNFDGDVNRAAAMMFSANRPGF